MLGQKLLHNTSTPCGFLPTPRIASSLSIVKVCENTVKVAFRFFIFILSWRWEHVETSMEMRADRNVGTGAWGQVGVGAWGWKRGDSSMGKLVRGMVL